MDTVIKEEPVDLNDENVSVAIKRGWGVFKLLSIDECCIALKELNETLRLAAKRFNDNLGLQLSRTYTCGEINGLGCAHLNELWKIRIAAKAIAARLIGNDDLLCSMEGYLHFHKEYMTRQNLSSVVETDSQSTGRWRCFVLLTESYPSGGGLRIKNKSHDEELRYVQVQRGSVLFIDPYRIEYKLLLPQVCKRDWSHDGRKHSNRVVQEELCIAPITYHPARDVSVTIIAQRMSCALTRRATCSDVNMKKRRSLNSGGGKSYDNVFILPYQYVQPHQLPPGKTLVEFRYENAGNIGWFLLDDDITKLIQGTNYKEK